ncbi:MAG: metalloregulator ArsR/SmtB family transcription factor [Rhodothermales bacterium]
MEVTTNGSRSLSGMNDYLIDSLKGEVGRHDRLDSLTSMMNAAGNDTRMRILYLLWRNREVRVNDLASILDVTTPAISQQLKKLRSQRLVRTRRDAQTVYYRLNGETPFVHALVEFFEELPVPAMSMRRAV